MPMIDVYAVRGTFPDPHRVAADAAAIVMAVEQVPDIALFRENTCAFVHELGPNGMADVDGSNRHVRVQVLTNAGALDRDKQLAVVSRLTDLVVESSGEPSLRERTWVLLTEAPDGGWGLFGHAYLNGELVQEARRQLAHDEPAR
jgi:phenylpyruvate tautomerase PptA (4-oxalocrotonate tautomerase family)